MPNVNVYTQILGTRPNGQPLYAISGGGDSDSWQAGDFGTPAPAPAAPPPQAPSPSSGGRGGGGSASPPPSQPQRGGGAGGGSSMFTGTQPRHPGGDNVAIYNRNTGQIIGFTPGPPGATAVSPDGSWADVDGVWHSPGALSGGSGGGGEGGGEGGGGGGFEFPGMSDEEKALLSTQNDILQLNLADLRRQGQLNAELFPGISKLAHSQLDLAISLFPQQAELLRSAIASAMPKPGEEDLLNTLNAKALDRAQGKAPLLTTDQKAQLDQVYQSANDEGMRQLQQFATEQAGVRGLRTTDTPIADVVLQQGRNLQEQLQGQKASATLSMGQANQAFDESVRQFQTGLRQQALTNRLALAGGAAQVPGMPQTNAAQTLSGSSGILASLESSRNAQAQFGLGIAQLNQSAANSRQAADIAAADRASRERIAGIQFGNQGGATSGQRWLSAAAPIAAAGLNTASGLPWGTWFGGGGASSTTNFPAIGAGGDVGL